MDEQRETSVKAQVSDEPEAPETAAGPEMPGAPEDSQASGVPQRDPRDGTMSMADYEEAMQDRNVHARARGLAAPYISGGRDPDPEATARQERFWMRLLIGMVVLIVVGGLVLSILVYVAGGGQ